MTTKMWKRQVVGAKIEATAGTVESLSGTDAAMNVYAPKLTPNIQMEKREGQGGFDYLAAVASARSGKFTCSTRVEWDGSATEPNWAETFFPACGYVKSGQVYSPTSNAPGSAAKTITIGDYIDGQLYLLYGCVGTFTINYVAGMPTTIDWEFEGVWGGKSDVALLTPTYPSDTCYRWANGAATWNSVALYASKATLKANNVFEVRRDASTESGFAHGIISDRYPTVDIDPESVLEATQTRHADWLASTERALALYCGGVGNSLFKADALKAQIMSMTPANRNGIAVDEIQFACNKNGSTQDQCLQFTFTAAT